LPLSSFDVFHLTAPLCEISGNDRPVATISGFLRTHQAERLGGLQQTLCQKISRFLHQPRVPDLPIVEIQEQVAELNKREIRNAGSPQQPLDALVRILCLHVCAHAATVRTQANIDNCSDAVFFEGRDQLIRCAAAVAYRV
jgi:hypothetical protein